jgi:integrase
MTIDMDGFNEKLLRRTNSKSTVRSYATAIRKFEEFAKRVLGLGLEQTVDGLKSGQLDVYRTLDRFVGWVNNTGVMPATVSQWTVAVKTFLRYQDVEVRTEIFKSKVSMPIADQISDVPITREILRKMLLSDAPLQLRCGIAVMASAGTRIGETMLIRLRDVHFDEDPVRIEIMKANVKATKHGRFAREVFISPEAAEMLKQYAEQHKLSSEDRLFGYIPSRFRRTLERWLPKWGLDKRIEGHRYHQIHPHIFRKFFFSNAVGPMGEVATHAMMGHNFYLKTYYARPLVDRQADYRKAIPSLTVLQGNNEEQLRKKVTLDQLRIMGLTPEQVACVERMMSERDLFVPDEEVEERIRELLMGAWGLKSQTPQRRVAGVW